MADPRAQKVLVTGGAGFIGSHLVECLLAQGAEVVVIDDLSTGREANLANLRSSRLTLLHGRVSQVVAGQGAMLAGVRQIFHLAASVGVQLVVSDPTRIIRNNVEETAAIIDAAGSLGASLLLASSSEVYGKSDALPLREDGDLVYGPTTGARWSYAMSKAIDEHLALSYDAQKKQGRGGAVVVRLFNTIGPRQVGHYGMVVPRFVAAAVRGEDLTVYGDGSQTRAFCDVRDVVQAMVSLLNDPKHEGQIFNVGSDQEITIHELADQVIALAQSNSRKRMISFDDAYRPGFEDPFRRRVPDVSKLRQAIGWRPRIALAATLRELIVLARGER